MVKNLPANAGDVRDAGLIPGLGRSPGKKIRVNLKESGRWADGYCCFHLKCDSRDLVAPSTQAGGSTALCHRAAGDTHPENLQTCGGAVSRERLSLQGLL